jgi:hypothetical protein
MRQPRRPPNKEGGAREDAAEPATNQSARSGNRVTSTAPTVADLAYPIVSRIHKIEPDIPLRLVAALTVEVLDQAAVTHQPDRWLEARLDQWPEHTKAAS